VSLATAFYRFSVSDRRALPRHHLRLAQSVNMMSSIQARKMTQDTRGDRGNEELWRQLPDLLSEAESDPEAQNRVITLLYPELRRIAEAHMRRERPDHTWQATALVSEFFVHLTRTRAFSARTKAQFLIIASVTMRRLLVDYARMRKATKRGGDFVRVDIECSDASETAHFADLLTIDGLLGQLADSDPRMAQIVELRFFGGLTNVEIAEVLNVHERTVKRDWQMARAWLYSQLRRGPA
jgi:RNA polymerase sigma factor (TIGR02999 family)